MLESLKSSVQRNAPVIFGLLIATLILWPILDLAVSLFITHAAFHYTIAMHVIRPLMFVAVFGLVDILVDMNRSRT